MIDSAAIQQIVKDTTSASFLFVPENYKFLLPLVTTTATAICAAAIRWYEKGEIESAHERDKTEILKTYLREDTAALKERLNQLKQKNEKL
jgi:hypothetical protein